MKKIEPKLTFQVGEKVVITDSHREYTYSGGFYPNKDDFAFTTIKEVLEDGSVITAEGYKYRQSYKTEFGELDIHDYFRIDRAPAKTIINNENYCCWNREYYLHDHFDVLSGWPTFLFKCTKEWEDKAAEYKEKALAYRKQKEDAETVAKAAANRRKPFLEAFHKENDPIREKYEAKENALWKKHICAHCSYNKNGICTAYHEHHRIKDMKYCADCGEFETNEE